MRTNNGRPVKTTNNAQRHSEDEVGSMAGTMREGSAANDMSAPVKMRDCEAITGSKGSSGTEKDFGGVGSYGADDQRQNFFEEKH